MRTSGRQKQEGDRQPSTQVKGGNRNEADRGHCQEDNWSQVQGERWGGGRKKRCAGSSKRSAVGEILLLLVDLAPSGGKSTVTENRLLAAWDKARISGAINTRTKANKGE